MEFVNYERVSGRSDFGCSTSFTEKKLLLLLKDFIRTPGRYLLLRSTERRREGQDMKLPRSFTPCTGSETMTDKKLSTDAVEWMYNRYIKDDPARIAHLELVRKQADLAQQIYDIREKLHMTREDLAEFSGLTPETIEDLEESDYAGDWDDAIERINRGFHNWFTNVILPAARMTVDDYSVKAVSA